MNLDALLATVTPERVRQIVETLVADRPPEQTLGAPVALVVQRILSYGGPEHANACWPVRDAGRTAGLMSRRMRYLESSG